MSVVYVNTALNKDSVLARKWGLHAEAGSVMAQVISELAPSGSDIIVAKEGYNGFFGTNLDFQLKELGVEHVLVTGIHTHVCVLLTAVAAFEHGYAVTTISDCVTTGYQPNHDSRLRFFVSHVGELMTAHEFMNSAR